MGENQLSGRNYQENTLSYLRSMMIMLKLIHCSIIIHKKEVTPTTYVNNSCISESIKKYQISQKCFKNEDPSSSGYERAGLIFLI
jgi:hypothetical protein